MSVTSGPMPPRDPGRSSAVETWIEASGAAMSGSPREVYFNSDPDPAPDRPFCDIAFPIGYMSGFRTA